MDHLDVNNPYQAPQASSITLLEEIQRPPVYTAIALFCWVLTAGHFLSIFGLISVLRKAINRLGWAKAMLYMAWPNPRPLLLLIASILGTFTYFAAGRMLWNRRGRLGLILCGTGIGITYLAIWFYKTA